MKKLNKCFVNVNCVLIVNTTLQCFYCLFIQLSTHISFENNVVADLSLSPVSCLHGLSSALNPSQELFILDLKLHQALGLKFNHISK